MKAKVTYLKHTNRKGAYISGSRLAVIDQARRMYAKGWNLTRDYHGGQIPYPKGALPTFVNGDDKHASIYVSR